MSESAPCFGVTPIRNFFERGQYLLSDMFDKLSPALPGIWQGKLADGGLFPTGTGWAFRKTTLGFKAAPYNTMTFNPMTGLQADCSGSCDVPAQRVNQGASQNDWVRMLEHAEDTEVFCLVKMAGDALNLEDQLTQQVMNLKMRTNQVDDEFSRRAFFGLSANRWAALDSETSPQVNTLWNFATNAVDGSPDFTYIELAAGVTAADLALPNVDSLNYVVQTGTYYGTFPKGGGAELISDLETAAQLPKFDTNVRADNRFRNPSSLNPGFNTIHDYANLSFMDDPYGFRYNYTEDDPAYPGGVLKRVEPWTDEAVSGGCWSKVSQAYLKADFSVSGFWNPNVAKRKRFGIDGNLPGGTYAQPQSPYTGLWRFINETFTPATPNNVDKTKAYWRMVYRMAMEPVSNGQHGHVYLHRRFGGSGNVKSCRTLASYPTGSYACEDTCVPLDWEPPATVDAQVCGTWNADAIEACCAPE